jgi:hypothetical protein
MPPQATRGNGRRFLRRLADRSAENIAAQHCLSLQRRTLRSPSVQALVFRGISNDLQAFTTEKPCGCAGSPCRKLRISNDLQAWAMDAPRPGPATARENHGISKDLQAAVTARTPE